MVKDRILDFVSSFPQGSIRTEILKNDDTSVVVKATVYRDHSIENYAVGHSEAYRKGNMGEVAVEVAETSAVGRALAMLGIGIIDGVASADEMVKASGGSHNAPGRTQYPKRELSVKHKNMLKVKIHKTGKPMPDESWFDELDYQTFNSALAKLKDLPETEKGWPSNLDNGDDRNDNIEGEKTIDYDKETGALL